MTPSASRGRPPPPMSRSSSTSLPACRTSSRPITRSSTRRLRPWTEPGSSCRRISPAWNLSKPDNYPVPRIFITGSADGLGRAAAGVLIREGHDVVLHARSRERVAALSDLAPDAAGVVVGDLSSAAETRDLAGQMNQIGRMDAVIHNAGVFLEPSRAATADGHAKTLAVNTLAPYLLTALIGRPDRLIYLSSGLHHRLWPGIVNAIVVPSRTAAPSRSQPSSSGA